MVSPANHAERHHPFFTTIVMTMLFRSRPHHAHQPDANTRMEKSSRISATRTTTHRPPRSRYPPRKNPPPPKRGHDPSAVAAPTTAAPTPIDTPPLHHLQNIAPSPSQPSGKAQSPSTIHAAAAGAGRSASAGSCGATPSPAAHRAPATTTACRPLPNHPRAKPPHREPRRRARRDGSAHAWMRGSHRINHSARKNSAHEGDGIEAAPRCTIG